MDRLRKTGALLCVGAIAGAASVLSGTSPDLCFTAGSVTYRLSPNAPSPDYRVAIDNQAPHPDLRIGLVDRVETADFALTDDADASTGDACRAGGPTHTVRIVDPGAEADIIIAVLPQQTAPDFALYVHSARVSSFEAAALLALVHRASDRDRVVDGAGDHVAIR